MTIQFVKTEVLPYGMPPSEEGEALKVVEICGRTAYKSEEKITEDSAKSFVLMLKKHRHLSVLEHSNIVFRIEENSDNSSPKTHFPLETFIDSCQKILKDRNAFHRFYWIDDSRTGACAVSGNFRSWIETLEMFESHFADGHAFFKHHLGRFFPNLFPPASESHNPYAFSVSMLQPAEQLSILKGDPSSDLPVFVFKFICDRGITHEVVRHRVFSFTQESTRYVNYKNKGMTLILPEELSPFYDYQAGAFTEENSLVTAWLDRGTVLFKWYQEDIERGLKPQIARDILPNLLKSEIFVTGRWSGWRHFILLRDSKQAHPRIRFIAKEVRRYFESIGLNCE